MRPPPPPMPELKRLLAQAVRLTREDAERSDGTQSGIVLTVAQVDKIASELNYLTDWALRDTPSDVA